MYFSRFLRDFRDTYSYAALKPVGGIPVTKHKDICLNRYKKLLYKVLGRWRWNGKYGTKTG